MRGMPLPAKINVRMTDADIAAGTQITVTLSDNGVDFDDVLAVVTDKHWQDTLLSGVCTIRVQRTAGTGTGATVGIC